METNAMELDDLKQAWQSLDRQLQQQKRINLQLLTESHMRKAKAGLRWLQAGRPSRVFNLGTGVGYSVLDMVHTFERVNNVTVPFHIAPRRPGDIARCFADPSKAEKLLGWKAHKSLEDMCIDAWRWQSLNPNGYATV